MPFHVDYPKKTINFIKNETFTIEQLVQKGINRFFAHYYRKHLNSPIAHLIEPRKAYRLIADNNLRKANIKNKDTINLLSDPWIYKVQKDKILNLIAPHREDEKKILVVRFGCEDADRKYSDLSLFMVVMDVDCEENNGNCDEFSERIFPIPISFSQISQPQIAAKLEHINYKKEIDNFLLRSKNAIFKNTKYNSSNETGGIAHFIKLPNGQRGVSALDWLNNYFDEKDEFVYLYPAYDMQKKHATVIFSKSGSGIGLLFGKQGEIFDEGASCCSR